jgi:hypothetical protein
MRLSREVPRGRMQSVVFLSLVVLVETAWAAALGYLVVHFV